MLNLHIGKLQICPVRRRQSLLQHDRMLNG
jgi:hypothetical protein